MEDAHHRRRTPRSSSPSTGPSGAASRSRQEISRRIAAADQQFKLARYKHGSDSVRGRLLVTLGPPSRQSQQRSQEGSLDDTAGVTAPAIDTRFQGDTSAAVLYTWTWDKDKLPQVLGLSELRARISVDPRAGTDELRSGAEVENAMATLAEKTIVNPNATLAAAKPAAPAVAAAPRAGAAAPPAGAPAAGAAAPPAPAVIPLPAAVKRRSSPRRTRSRARPGSGPARFVP